MRRLSQSDVCGLMFVSGYVGRLEKDGDDGILMAMLPEFGMLADHVEDD